jgi:thiamine biosynthesis lipoprotein
MSVRAFPLIAQPRLEENRRSFPCFGGRCTVIVADADRPADAAGAAAMSEQALLAWHRRFSRFTPDSELSRLNRDPNATVAASPLMRRIVAAALTAARDTGGLVDFTLADEIERAGYAAHMDRGGTELRAALEGAPARVPASPHPAARWRQVTVDQQAGTVTRPPGLRIDVGGIAKGVFADELAGMLDGFDAYVIDCAGAGLVRPVHIESPFGEERLGMFALAAGAVATSGIGRRSWMAPGGQPAHHLLDPHTGTPVFTGIVQASALAPTATRAEVLAKTAILSGPSRAAEWLCHGGLFVGDDGGYERLEPTASGSPARTRAVNQATMSSSTASRSGSLRISWNRPS